MGSGAAYCFAFRGVWALIMILGPNWADLTWNDLLFTHNPSTYHKDVEATVHEKLLMKPHLNSALRAEILYFTTQGIMFATKQAAIAMHQAEMNRLSLGVGRQTDDFDDDMRGSSFSFKDILERYYSIMGMSFSLEGDNNIDFVMCCCVLYVGQVIYTNRSI